MGARGGPCWNFCCFLGDLHTSDSMVMLALMQWRILQFLPFCLTAICTHLVVSGGQTFFHCWLGHRRLGGALYRNHIKFHHAYYARGHLVSATYRSGEGNNTPFFLIPTVLVAAGMFFLLPFELFVVTAFVSAASFYAHVLLDKEYHVEDSRRERFAWFRRKQQLHFVHHLHANRNFAIIDFFWDKLTGTYQRFEANVADVDKPNAELPPGGEHMRFGTELSL
jgi:hypothetical protein